MLVRLLMSPDNHAIHNNHNNYSTQEPNRESNPPSKRQSAPVVCILTRNFLLPNRFTGGGDANGEISRTRGIRALKWASSGDRNVPVILTSLWWGVGWGGAGSCHTDSCSFILVAITNPVPQSPHLPTEKSIQKKLNQIKPNPSPQKNHNQVASYRFHSFAEPVTAAGLPGLAASIALITVLGVFRSGV